MKKDTDQWSLTKMSEKDTEVDHPDIQETEDTHQDLIKKKIRKDDAIDDDFSLWKKALT